MFATNDAFRVEALGLPIFRYWLAPKLCTDSLRECSRVSRFLGERQHLAPEALNRARMRLGSNGRHHRVHLDRKSVFCAAS